MRQSVLSSPNGVKGIVLKVVRTTAEVLTRNFLLLPVDCGRVNSTAKDRLRIAKTSDGFKLRADKILRGSIKAGFKDNEREEKS
jgi:hypothetical protein